MELPPRLREGVDRILDDSRSPTSGRQPNCCRGATVAKSATGASTCPSAPPRPPISPRACPRPTPPFAPASRRRGHQAGMGAAHAARHRRRSGLGAVGGARSVAVDRRRHHDRGERADPPGGRRAGAESRRAHDLDRRRYRARTAGARRRGAGDAVLRAGRACAGRDQSADRTAVGAVTRRAAGGGAGNARRLAAHPAGARPLDRARGAYRRAVSACRTLSACRAGLVSFLAPRRALAHAPARQGRRRAVGGREVHLSRGVAHAGRTSGGARAGAPARRFRRGPAEAVQPTGSWKNGW